MFSDHFEKKWNMTILNKYQPMVHYIGPLKKAMYSLPKSFADPANIHLFLIMWGYSPEFHSGKMYNVPGFLFYRHTVDGLWQTKYCTGWEVKSECPMYFIKYCNFLTICPSKLMKSLRVHHPETRLLAWQINCILLNCNQINVANHISA